MSIFMKYTSCHVAFQKGIEEIYSESGIIDFRCLRLTTKASLLYESHPLRDFIPLKNGFENAQSMP